MSIVYFWYMTENPIDKTPLFSFQPLKEAPLVNDPRQTVEEFLTQNPAWDARSGPRDQFSRWSQYVSLKGVVPQWAADMRSKSGSLDVTKFENHVLDGSTGMDELLALIADGIFRDPRIGFTPDLEVRFVNKAFNQTLQQFEGVDLTDSQSRNLNSLRDLHARLNERQS